MEQRAAEARLRPQVARHIAFGKREQRLPQVVEEGDRLGLAGWQHGVAVGLEVGDVGLEVQGFEFLLKCCAGCIAGRQRFRLVLRHRQRPQFAEMRNQVFRVQSHSG